MAQNKRIDIEMRVLANTEQAKKQFENLQRSLTTAAGKMDLSAGFGKNFMNDIHAAQNEVAKLQSALQSAYNTETGKLDFTKLQSSMKSLGLDTEHVADTLRSMGPAGLEALKQLTIGVQGAEIPVKKLNAWFEKLATTLRNTIRWQISATALNTFIGAIQTAYGYAQDLNSSLNDIRIVTGYSAEKMSEFAENANKAAKSLSASTLAYTDAALIFYQQGLSDKEVLERTNATIKMSNVTGEQAEQVSSYMTAIWNNFADGSQTLEYYADVITELGARTAASSEEIAHGMEKFAAVGETVGLSYEYAAAAVTTVIDKTRLSADVVGTSFKTLFARLEGLSLGETLEDGTTLTKYSKALATVGVNIKDQAGQLKQMDEILDELGSKWEMLSSDQQVALAQTVGGVRQYTQLISLMENYDAFKENVEAAKDSEGTLNRQQRIFEESWEGASKRLKASWEAIYSDIIEDDFFIELTDTASKFLDAIDKILDRMGGLKGLLTQLAPIVTTVFNKQIANGLKSFGNNIVSFAPGYKQKKETERQDMVANLFQGRLSKEQQIELRYTEIIRDNVDQLDELEKDRLFNLKEILKVQQQIGEEIDREAKVRNGEKTIEARDLARAQEISQNATTSLILNGNSDASKQSFNKLMGLKVARGLSDVSAYTPQEFYTGISYLRQHKTLGTAFNGHTALVDETMTKMDELLKRREADVEKEVDVTELDLELEELQAKFGDEVENLLEAQARGIYKKLSQEYNQNWIEAPGSNDIKIDSEFYQEMRDRAVTGVQNALEEAATERANSYETFKEIAKENRNSVDSNKALRNETRPTEDYATKMVGLAQSFAYASAASDILSNAISQLGDDAVSGEEKIAVLGQTLVSGLMQVGSFLQTDLGRQLAKSIKLDTFAESMKGKIAGLMGDSGVLGSVLSAVPYVAIAAAVAKVAYDIVRTVVDTQLKNEQQKYAQGLEDTAQWRQENEALIEAIDNYHKLREEIDETGEYSLEFKDHILETAEALGIENAALLAQAGAYDLLKSKIEDTEGALEEEGRANSERDFANFQGLTSLGTQRANLTEDLLYVASIGGLLSQAVTGRRAFETNSLSGGYTSNDEGTFLKALGELGIENGLQIGANSFSYDFEQMSDADQVKFAQFLADVQNNAGAYGLGENSEFLQGISTISEDMETVASQLKDSLDYLVVASAREQGVDIRNNNNSDDSIFSYNTDLEELSLALQEEYGLTEEDAYTYASQALNELYSGTVAAQSAVLKEYAELTGQDLNDVVASLEGYSEDDLASIITAMGANAAATHAILENVEGTTEQLEYIKALTDSLDVSTLIASLDAIYEFIEKLKSGDTVKGEDLETLASEMGFNSVEEFLEAFGDSFTKVANDKYIFTGVAEDFRRGFEDYTSRQLTDYMNSGISYSDLLEQIGEGKTTGEWSDEATEAQNAATLDQSVLNALDILNPTELNMQGYQLNKDDFLSHLAELMGITTEEVQGVYDELIRNGTLTEAEDGIVIDYEGIAAAQQQYSNDLETNQSTYQTAQEKVQALSTFEDLAAEAERWESGDKTAFEEQLVTEYTTLEELQDLYEEGYISADKYHKSIAAAALQEAENLGIDSKELAEHANFLAENNQYLEDDIQASYDVALANERVNKGLEDLYSNMDNYISILNEGRVDSEDYQETISALSDDLQNMFNYDEDVSEDFILEHLTDIQAAADGDLDAVNRLQIAFAQMRVSEEDAALGMNDIWNEIEAMDWDELEIGVTMDTAPAIESLTQLMIQAGMSADAIQDTLNSLGWEADLITTKGPNGEQIVTGVRSKNSHYIGSNRRGLNTNTKKDKGSGKSSKKDEKDFKDEFERYYKITRQIKDQQDATERLNKAKERAFGKAKLEYLDQEADSMQREIDLQKEYLDEIRGYYASDKGNLEAFGATFDENGVLTNYEQLINSELAKYNQAVEAYNANQDEAAFESAEKRFNYFKDVLKQYDETNQLYQEQLDNLTDMQNKWYDMALQKTQLKVEMEIAIDDRDLELLEYALDRIEKKAFATAEALAKITQSVGDTLDKQKIYQDALEEILSRHGINGIDAVNSLSDEQIANLGFTQDEIDAIVEYNSNLLDIQKEMDKLQDEILNGPLKAFKEWNEEFDYQEDKIQRNIDLLNQYKNIADLIYSNSSAVGQEYIMSLMTNTYDSMVLGVDAARLELRANQEALEKAKQSYEEAITNGAGEETLNTLKKNLREMEKAVEDSEDDMLKKTEEALKQAEELFKAMIENAKNSFKELTSVTDWDMTQFDRLKSLDDEYLDDYAKIYEFAKLTRDINNSIDDTDTIRGKERLREITQEIADIEAQGREVSQYEVDALRAKYELRLAEIALENAQNAKSVVRMNRDNEGNWSYVYTADEDNVDKARQNYEDKLYEYQKLNSEFIKTQQENFLKLEQEYTDAMQKIAEDSSLSREDKEARLQETQAYYQRMAEIMSDQLGIALNKNSELYNKDWLDYSQHTGYKISMEEQYQTKLDDTYTGHLQPNIDSATQLLAQFTEAAIGEGGFYPSIIGALDEFADRQDEVLQAAGTSLMDYADDMQRSAEDIETSMDEAAESMAEDFDTIMAKMAEINAASFDGLRDSVTNAISSINDLVAAYERLSNASNAAQDSSIGSAGGGLQDFSSLGGGGNGGSGAKGINSSNTGSKSDDNRSSNQKAADFLWYFYTKKDSPYGSGMWAGIKQQMYTLSRDTNELIGYLTNPRNNIQNAETIQQYIERNRLNLGSFRNWAKQNFAQVYAANAFDTGGYTGAWGTEGRLAFLHQKELVLNADDTENMLNIVQMVRDITSAIDTRASLASVANINNGMYGSVGTGAQALDQNVHIEANFPNVTDHNEIEMALSNLVNQAAQYANRKS